MVSRAATYSALCSVVHCTGLHRNPVRASGFGICGSMVIRRDRRARSPPIRALFPVIAHSRSFGRVRTSLLPSTRSVTSLEVSSPSSACDRITPRMLSNAMIGAVVRLSMVKMTLPISSSRFGRPGRSASPVHCPQG